MAIATLSSIKAIHMEVTTYGVYTTSGYKLGRVFLLLSTSTNHVASTSHADPRSKRKGGAHTQQKKLAEFEGNSSSAVSSRLVDTNNPACSNSTQITKTLCRSDGSAASTLAFRPNMRSAGSLRSSPKNTKSPQETRAPTFHQAGLCIFHTGAFWHKGAVLGLR